MEPEGERQTAAELDEMIAAYEAAQARGAGATLVDFLPATDHPLYRPVLCELIRIELEAGWENGQPRPLRDYLEIFPALVADRAALQKIAFAEYRLRCQAGEEASPDVYQREWGISTAAWPLALAALSRGVPPQDDAAARGSFFSATGLSSWGASSWRAEPLQGRRALDAADPEAARLLAQALTALPEAESTFLDFRLVAELGRGAFGRVYLARQGDLADRWVALKISVDVAGESQTLAQLQHTNIVPIYSIHQAGMFQAVCMPYFGPTTLADLLHDLRQRGTLPTSGKDLVNMLRMRSGPLGKRRDDDLVPVPAPLLPVDEAVLPIHELEQLSYVDAVLWIGARLAEGLDHAHERGILHRDLKPANVLLSDEGRPMLLDFNLSADTKASSGAQAHHGGTLPYMAPEHLQAFATGEEALDCPVDARSDLYALGVILYELLTGNYPFATRVGSYDDVLPRMLAERRAAVPGLRRWNKKVTPASEAIVQHLLEPDPHRRYQSAVQLRTDLRRQLEARPLRHARDRSLRERAKKWVRHNAWARSRALWGTLLLMTGAAALALLFWQRMNFFEISLSSKEIARQRAEQEATAAQKALRIFQEETSTARKALQVFQTAVTDLRERNEEIASMQAPLDEGPLAMLARNRAVLKHTQLIDRAWQGPFLSGDKAWPHIPS
jgi:eukaryotic-like serine/threonine-protein kinase